MFSNYNYDVIIIGGGISGLFLAYKLLDTNLKVIILESSKGVGGRIKTIHKEGMSFEAGAARFHRSHGKLISLIHDLKLEKETVQLPKGIDHILRKKKINFPYGTNNSLSSFQDLIIESFQLIHKFSKEELEMISFFQYLTLVYDHETALFIKDSFGYDSEFINLNASTALQMFKDDLFGEDNYYSLKGGLSQIIDKMEEEIEKTNTIIKTKCHVKEINDNYVITHKGEKFYYEHLICAIPPKALYTFDYFKDNLSIQAVDTIPLLRVYAKYPTKNLWFKNIQRTTTDNYIRQIIPIDYEEGLIMISYTDGKNAELLQSYNKLGEEFLMNAIHKEIKDLFGISPPKPKFISAHYWEDGFHLWKLGENSGKTSKEILKLDKEKEVYICGEAFSMKQGWMEGSLETCYSILSMLPPLKSYEIVNYQFMCGNIQKEEEEKEEVEKEEEKEEEVEKKVGKKIVQEKLYTIDQVLKEDEWIIIEVDGEKKIYDVSQWIQHHPGGDAIFEGIEANNHYKNKKLYPDSPTDLFNGIHYHHEEKAFEKYFQKENKYVKLVGRLK